MEPFIQAPRPALEPQAKISASQISTEDESSEVEEVEETLDDYSEVAEEQHDELDYDESIYI